MFNSMYYKVSTGTKTDKRRIKPQSGIWIPITLVCKWKYPIQNDCECHNSEEGSLSCSSGEMRRMGIQKNTQGRKKESSNDLMINRLTKNKTKQNKS